MRLRIFVEEIEGWIFMLAVISLVDEVSLNSLTVMKYFAFEERLN